MTPHSPPVTTAQVIDARALFAMRRYPTGSVVWHRHKVHLGPGIVRSMNGLMRMVDFQGLSEPLPSEDSIFDFFAEEPESTMINCTVANLTTYKPKLLA